ncbi:piwi-like protein 1 [Littorina saxatilis]|uniref:Uncharacterized protein n=1 Tax=Littorina saxatilis TaxID=31220 RepID=A0AAN9AJ55_9CAEN
MTGRARGRARGRVREAAAQRPGSESGAPAQPPPAAAGPPPGASAPPPSQQQVPAPQGAAPPQEGAGPVGGSGRASYRGSGKPQRPGNGGAGDEPPTAEMAAMGVDQDRGPRRWRSEYDNGTYRPDHVTTKMGTAGTEIMLKGNFFKLNYARDWRLYQYHVDYLPPVENKKIRGALLASHSEVLGDVRAFDGMILYLPHKLPDKVTELNSWRRHDNAVIKIKIALTCEVPPGTTQTLQVMNIIWRRVLGLMGMSQISRHYFNLNNSIKVEKHFLEVIPGFQTSILQYEHDVLLEIDIAHKILRMETVLDVMNKIWRHNKQNFHALATREVVGTIVMTLYNNKTYRVDDIDWKKNPSDTFDMRDGAPKSYVDYYHQQHDKVIRDLTQPLLVSKPKKRDIRRGQVGMIYLLPELCTITGLSDANRADFRLMNDVAVHTRIAPDGRVKKLMSFMNSIKKNETVVKELAKWNLAFAPELENIKARQLPQEAILMTDRGKDVALTYRQDEADWSRDMRGKKMRLAVDLGTWLVVFPRECAAAARNLVSTLSQVGPPMGMRINQPTMLEMPSDRNESYLMTLREHVNRPNVQMALCILSNNKKDRYDAIKKFCCIDCPVPSQMVVKHTLEKAKNLMSVATKIAIQMNCKMGGVVWALQIPLKGTMIMGIDTYHDSSARGRSCGGVVATTNADFTRYHSTVSFQMTHQELQTHLRIAMTSCLRAYHKSENALPQRVIVFRDGVGDGQLDMVNDMEVPEMVAAIKEAGGTDYKVMLTYIVVKKRISARFFKMGQFRDGGGDMRSGPTNPPPGTIIDDVATKPTWYDFFLISQSVRQGTVGPTHYNIIYETNGLKPDHFQRLTYKLTHMYYNWQGTIRVPAPCMYAHKLAFLSGQSLHRDFHAGLADKLFFL